MPRKIYSILIGIDHYPPPYQLYGCVSDVRKIEAYLGNLNHQPTANVTRPLLLLNEDATKANVATQLKEVISKLENEDTLLLYYSGHGTQETSENRFKDDHNNLLQSIVCYHTQEKNEPFLLASKELRYLFSELKNDAHILAVFDCCHSGDITRSTLSSKTMRRMSVKNAQRPYSDFIFSEKFAEQEFQKKEFNEVVPDANVVTLSACDSTESAWEDLGGGVFTQNLIETLGNNGGLVNYNELVSAIEINIRQRTQEKQTPTIDVLGSRTYHQLSSWLGLNGKELKTASGFIKFNKKLGWIYNKGKLAGLANEDKVNIRLDDLTEVQLRIEKVELTSSLIEDPSMEGIMLDFGKTYAVIPTLFSRKPVVAIHNLTSSDDLLEPITTVLKKQQTIKYSDHLLSCDYELVFFNNSIYLALPNCQYQPLHMPFNLTEEDLEDTSGLETFFTDHFQILANWFHLDQLQFNDGFSEIPIKVEIQTPKNNQWVDITNGSFSFSTEMRHPGKNVLYQTYSMRVTNTTEKDLYVTSLAVVNSLLEVSAYPFENRTILLTPNTSKQFENVLFFDHYQEIYNWEFATVHFKWIVNNHTNISTSIASMTQNGFAPPLTHLDTMRGAGGLSVFEPKKQNAVYSSKVTLKNTEVGKISGVLPSHWQWYKNNEMIAPLLEQLYPTSEVERMNTDLSLTRTDT